MAIFEKENKAVNIKMMITAEKIISNIDKVQKILDPKSKKQIIDLGSDLYFRDLVESITQYLKQYPNKNNFPVDVYKEAYGLVEYATSLFESNNEKVEKLIAQREKNIKISILLNEALDTVVEKEEFWIDKLDRYEGRFEKDTAEALTIIANDSINTAEQVEMAIKVVKAKISNLEQNLHIDLDIERLEGASKALSYIGIEVAEALKSIPTPSEHEVTAIEEANINEALENELKELTIQEIVKNEVKSNEENEKLESQKKAVKVENFLTEDTKDNLNSTDDVVKQYNALVEESKMQTNPLDVVLTETVKVDQKKLDEALSSDSIDSVVQQSTAAFETLEKSSTQKTIPISQQRIFEEDELKSKNKKELSEKSNETDDKTKNFDFYDAPKKEKKSIFSKVANVFKSMFSINGKQKALPEV